MSESDLVEALRAASCGQNYHRWIFRKIEPYLGCSVLDIGSGLGVFSGFFKKDKTRAVILSDSSRFMVERLRKLHEGVGGVAVAQLDISRDIPSGSFPYRRAVDTVTCLNVLEHIKDDVEALRRMRDLVSESGKVVLFVPALRFLYGSLDRMAAHFRRYTRDELLKKLEAAGLKPLKLEYFNFWGIFSWFLAGKVLRQPQLEAAACSRLDKLVPWISLPERFCSPPLGQSIFAVACHA